VSLPTDPAITDPATAHLVDQDPVDQYPVEQDMVSEADALDEDRRARTDFVGLVRSWAPVVIASIVIAVVVRTFLFQSYLIPSDSMVSTLVDGDRVIVNRLSYTFGEIERGQVVVFTRPPMLAGEDDVIKRVIGLPRETVRFIDNQVYIDGARVVEPYLLQQSSTFRDRIIPGCAQEVPASDLCVVPDGHVFVLGDNRTGSEDGRVFGPIAADTIVGRAFVRVWPLSHFGRL